MNAYVQDTWKVTSHLTVNAGVRWEPFLPPSEINGSVYNFSLPESDRGSEEHAIYECASRPLVSGRSRFHRQARVSKAQWNLFAPRVALAWDPKGDGKMVIRAGWGISYDYVAGELMVNSADAPPYGGTEIWSGQFSNPYATNPGGNIYPIHGQYQCAVCSGWSLHLFAAQPENSLDQPMESGDPAAIRHQLAGVGHLHGKRKRASVGFLPGESSRVYSRSLRRGTIRPGTPWPMLQYSEPELPPHVCAERIPWHAGALTDRQLRRRR